jgi:transcriptional regulator with PAS, ATPase and Fis domain
MKRAKNTATISANDLLTIFEGLKERFISPFQIVVRIDNNGTITETIPLAADSQLWTINGFHSQQLTHRNIRELFHLPEKPHIKTLSRTAKQVSDFLSPQFLYNAQKAYPSRNVFELYEMRYGFFADLPYSTLFLRHHPDIGMVGIIRYNDMGARLLPYRAMPLIVLNRAGKMKGYNQCFQNLFPKQTTLFNQPANHLVSPDPLTTLTGQPADFLPALNDSWGTPKDISHGHHWSTGTQGRHFLYPFKTEINTLEQDFRLEVDFTIESGEFPSVVIGSDTAHDTFFPDLQGYIAGPRPGTDSAYKTFVLKKEGNFLHSTDFPPSCLTGRHRFTVIWQRPVISCFVDQQFILGIRDPRMNVSIRSQLYLYCRRATTLQLHGVHLSTLPSSRHLSRHFNEVRFNIGIENSFECFPVQESFPGNAVHEYYIFTFHNISHLKQDISQLARERDRYRALALPDEKGNTFIGESPDIHTIKQYARKAATSDIAILIEGETGTGKEVLARYIHDHSSVRQGPFVSVDCSTLPESLIESELFGVQKGAFTGAVETRAGKLEAANGGTLFLDELGNLDLKTQAKLLTFLQDFKVVRLGSNRPIKVQTRLLAATNRPLKGLIDKKLFRADLYYRLSAVRFELPPLKERLEDIPLLCDHFLRQFSLKLNRVITGFSEEATRLLSTYYWPGNIRELANVIQRAVLFCDGHKIQAAHVSLPELTALSAKIPETEPAIPTGDARALTEAHIRLLLSRNNGIAIRAAREAQVSRATFYRKMKRFGIR